MVRNPEPLLAALVVVLAIAAAMLASRKAVPRLGWWERPLASLARHKKLAILISAAVPLILRAALLPWFPTPEPRVQDEFTFLLGADTLLHGRLTNPPHPFWMHFETMHVLVRPTYASAFPIAPASFLAAGKLFLGSAWAGVWLSGGLMCAAVCWMLQGWLPPRWALLGALLLSLRIGVSSYWMNSYWGGFVAAAGGALVLGALPRVLREPRWTHALIMGVGLALLAQSRSFEGAIFAVAVIAALLVRMWQSPIPKRHAILRQFGLPLVMAALVIGVGICYYFWRVTGKPWLAPYVLYRNTTTTAPHFIFQKPTPPPLYDNRAMQDFYTGWEILAYQASLRLPQDFGLKVQAYWRFYVGPLFSIPLLALFFAWRGRAGSTLRQLLCISAFFSLALLAEVWHNLHYAAPATGLVILLVMVGMRQLRIWRLGRHRAGLAIARILPVACALTLALQIVAGPIRPSEPDKRGWRWPGPGCVARALTEKQLRDAGGQHLVFVRYATRHEPGLEWVYNGADIDREPVVWARELDAESNARLMKYFSQRQVWLVEPDKDPDCTGGAALIPYREARPVLMPFVPLGAPGIESIRSPEELRRKMLATGEARTFAAWNSTFSKVTGVAPPQAARPNNEAEVPFDKWWTWLNQSRY